MKWAWRIGQFAGIAVYIHATFLLLIGWVLFEYYRRGSDLATMLGAVAFVLVLFLCVVLHEFGHALTARRYGIRTRDITLLPIGGVARLERMPEDPKQELAVAVAGPAVNVVIAGVLFVVATLWLGVGALLNTRMVGGDFLTNLMWVNVMLVVFNMIPAFPMDGGRVLRALLAMKRPYHEATQIAAGVGQGIAVLFGLVGLFYNPFLVFIALFVYLGAAAEANAAQVRHAFADIPVRDAMVTDFRVLATGQPLRHAVDLLLEGYQRDFPVMEDGRVVGMLCRNDLIASVERRGPETTVGEVMRTEFCALDPQDMLQEGFVKMQTSDCPVMPVLHAGHLVGLITVENVGEFVMVQAALRGRRPPAGLRVSA
jgi:Zn-dependent protease